jgi:hypothetical protein
VLTWFRYPLQSSFRSAFLFNEWSFKGAVRANPKFLSASIHDLHFLVAAGFLAFVASKDVFDRGHKNLVFMEGFNVCVWAEWINSLATLYTKQDLKIGTTTQRNEILQKIVDVTGLTPQTASIFFFLKHSPIIFYVESTKNKAYVLEQA